MVTGIVPVTFPVGSLMSSFGAIQAADTVSSDQIIQAFAASGIALSGGFNGAVYNFSGLSSPISNVSVDPASSFSPTSIAFTGNEVDVNEAGLAITAGENLILDVTTGGPVTTPEPSTSALLGAGLAGLAGFGFRRLRSSTAG